MGDGIKMTYDEMDRTCTELTSIVGEIITYKDKMMTNVENLCDSWKSNASEHHRGEFQNVDDQISKLTGMAEQLVASVKQYRADMEELDNSYA